MTNLSLAESYLLKARSRLKVLQVLLDEGDFSEPPKWHDVGGFLLQFGDRFPAIERDRLTELAEISARLRKEREFSFYGDIDFIPTEQYSHADAQRAVAEAHVTVEAAARIIPMLATDEKPRR